MTTAKETAYNVALSIIKTTGDDLANAIHAAGMYAVEQANEHGNIGFGTRLIEAMGKKHDVARVEKWLCHFGKFGMKKGILVYRQRKDIKEETLQAFLDKAEATPYWELTEQTHHVFKVNYLVALASMLKQHDKVEALQAEGKEAVELNVQVLEDVRVLLAKYTPAPAAVAA